MSDQRSDYELAYGEIHHALQAHGDGPEFAAVCNAVETRLSGQYPDDRHAIVEMIHAWLVQLGAADPETLRGMV